MLKYLKAIVAVLAAGGVAAQAALTDNTITPAEWVAIAIAAAGALGVWSLPNKPAQPPAATASGPGAPTTASVAGRVVWPPEREDQLRS